jgi:uncharacterized membrane protein
MSMGVAYYRLNAYLNAPHPHDDAYYLAGLAYLICIPSVLDSLFMVLFVAYISRGEHAPENDAEAAEGSSKQLSFIVGVGVALSLLSCAFAASLVYTVLYYDVSLRAVIAALGWVHLVLTVWAAVSVSCLVFSVFLMVRTRSR